VLAFGLIAAAPYAAAQCDGVSVGTNYKVLIDEVEYAAAVGNQPVLSLELLQTSVEGALEKLRRRVLMGSAPQENIVYLNCRGRHPQESEFDEGFVRSMVANHAILEFWGTLFSQGGGQHEFDIHYVMFPLGDLAPPRPSEFAATQKRMASRPTPPEIKDYMVDARADLPAYFAVAAGVQAYADHNWDQALRFLCEARTRLKKKADKQDLMNFADQVASKAASKLRNNNLTAASLLTDAQAKNYCIFATTR
jgi:hypothetical protein